MDSWYDMEEDKAHKEFMNKLEESLVKAYRDYIRRQKEEQVKTILNKWKDDRLHNNRNNRNGVDSL